MVLHGETGLIVPIGDHDALVTALVTVATDSATRQRLGEAARRRYYSEYSAASQEVRFTGIFQRIDAGFMMQEKKPQYDESTLSNVHEARDGHERSRHCV